METRINTKSGKLLTVYDDLCPVSLINDIFFQLRSQEYPLVPSNDTVLQDFKGVSGFGKNVDVEFIRSILDNIKSPESFTLKRIVNRGKIEKSWINSEDLEKDKNKASENPFGQLDLLLEAIRENKEESENKEEDI